MPDPLSPNPSTARPRPDLTFLRRRYRPRPEPPSPPPTPAREAASAPTISFDRPGRKPRSGDAAPSAPASSPLDLSAAPTISFDRPGRGPTGTASRGSSSTLDLSAAPQPGAGSDPAPSTVARAPKPAVRPVRGERVPAGRQHLLTVADPTALLTRIQSGVGTLEIEAACSSDAGDLRIGAAYELRSGHTSTVQLAANGNRFAPSSRRPVIVAGRGSGSDEFERLRLDLRQIRELRRVAVYAFSESRAELEWGGTLVVSTAGGARIELPLETLYRGRVAMLISLYNVDGELAVRAEMETVAGDVREAARAYGYDRITWRDDRTPVDP